MREKKNSRVELQQEKKNDFRPDRVPHEYLKNTNGYCSFHFFFNTANAIK